MPLLIVALLLAIWIVALTTSDAVRLRRLRSLDGARPDAIAGEPRVSIVIPARNEADSISRCVNGALAQHYPAVEVIVVDDGSTDATPRLLADYATRFPDRLRVIAGLPLPSGWVGKPNACLHGARGAHGEWLIFLDADTHAQPGLVTALLARVQQQQLDAISVLPFNELPTLAERLILPLFYQFAFTAFPLHKMLVPEAPAQTAMANGQCLMIATRAYWSLGGHEAVKDKVLEDVELAQALRRAGYRLGIATAFEHLRVRMYRDLGQIVQGLAKHATAGRRISGWRAFWAVLRLTLTVLVAPALVVACLIALVSHPGSPAAWWATAGAIGAYASVVWFWASRYRRWYGQPGWTAVLAPAGWVMYLAIAVRGTFQVAFRRGVRWKDRTYPLVGRE
jgi:hypothetical protein